MSRTQVLATRAAEERPRVFLEYRCQRKTCPDCNTPKALLVFSKRRGRRCRWAYCRACAWAGVYERRTGQYTGNYNKQAEARWALFLRGRDAFRTGDLPGKLLDRFGLPTYPDGLREYWFSRFLAYTKDWSLFRKHLVRRYAFEAEWLGDKGAFPKGPAVYAPVQTVPGYIIAYAVFDTTGRTHVFWNRASPEESGRIYLHVGTGCVKEYPCLQEAVRIGGLAQRLGLRMPTLVASVLRASPVRTFGVDPF